MPRERASINVDIWSDDDFRNLTAAAQSLYFKLTTHPKLDYCGVTDFHPGRLAAMSVSMTADDVMSAAQELSDHYFIVVDQATDEVLVRSFIRHDGLLKQPRLAVSAAKAYGSIASNKIRAVVVHELLRYQRENPELGAWEKPQVRTVLKQTAVPVRETLTTLEWDVSSSAGQRYGQRLPQTLPDTTGSPTTATATATSPAPSPNGDSNTPHKRGVRLDPAWEPAPELVAQMRSEVPHVDLTAQHRQFVDYWIAQPGQKGVKTDWPATWRNWMRRAGERTTGQIKLTAAQRNLSVVERFAALESDQQLEA